MHATLTLSLPPSFVSPWRMRNIQECNSCTFASASMIFSLSTRALAFLELSLYERPRRSSRERKSMLALANVQELNTTLNITCLVVELNKLSVAEAMKVREKFEEEKEERKFRVYICGKLGPRGGRICPRGGEDERR